METLWIARDKDNNLFIYNNKPVIHKEYESFDVDLNNNDSNIFYFERIIQINSKLFPEVTWENSPQQVELKLIKNDSNS